MTLPVGPQRDACHVLEICLDPTSPTHSSCDRGDCYGALLQSVTSFEAKHELDCLACSYNSQQNSVCPSCGAERRRRKLHPLFTHSFWRELQLRSLFCETSNAPYTPRTIAAVSDRAHQQICGRAWSGDTTVRACSWQRHGANRSDTP